MSLIPSGELKGASFHREHSPWKTVSMSLIPSGELKVVQVVVAEVTDDGVSMSLIPSGELKEGHKENKGRKGLSINESNSLRGVEREAAYQCQVPGTHCINESNSLRGVERRSS